MSCVWKHVFLCGLIMNSVYNAGYCYDRTCETLDECYGSTQFSQFFHGIYFDPNSPEYQPDYICENSNPLKVWCDDKLKRQIQEDEICGQVISEDINFGPKTEINEFPWMALLLYTDGKTTESSCQGVLISNEVVMTSATCLRPNTNGFELTSVILGEWNKTAVIDCDNSSVVSICNDPPVVVPIGGTRINKYFVKSTDHNYNTGLIHLTHKVEYTEFIKPICLPYFVHKEFTKQFYPGRRFEIASWGETSPDGKKSEILLKAYLEAVACPRNSDSLFCIHSTRNQNVCAGDEGAPIMGRTKKGNRTYVYLAGIVSNSNDCRRNGGPIFFGDRVQYPSGVFEEGKKMIKFLF